MFVRLTREKKDSNNAFSLLSVLVTIALICVIISLSSYVFTLSYSLVNRFRCSSHLKQIYHYWIMYLDENQDHAEKFDRLDTKNGLTLKNILENFLSQKKGYDIDLTKLFICPSDKKHTLQEMKERGSYDYSSEMIGETSRFIFSNIQNPQEKILMGDFRAGWHDKSHSYGKLFHGEKKINVLFADGHVEYILESKWQHHLKRQRHLNKK